MLLRFGVSNFTSLRDSQELSLVASTLKDRDVGVLACPAAPEGKALSAAIVYGANASGKSNVVRALRSMCFAVRSSHSRGEPGEKIARQTFALDPEFASKPSEFYADFVVDDVRYHYGYEVSNDAYESEWLFGFGSGRRSMLFSRKGQSFKFGRGLKGRNRTIADLTRRNSLFLSAAAQNDHEALTNVANFFRTIQGSTAVSVQAVDLVARNWTEQKLDQRVISFLQTIGTGVVGYRRRKRLIPEDAVNLQKEFYALLAKAAPERADSEFELSTSFTEIKLGHRGHDGKSIFLELEQESAGTRRLLVLLSSIFEVLDDGALMVIDELEASLHTRASEALLALFSSRKTNPNGAQLIATTHDTNLLRSPLLRRDHVWFAEKDKSGATHIYPLTDIRTRKEDNLEKGYLQGRFGAIPFAGPAPLAFG